MTRHFRNQTLEQFYDQNSAAMFTDLEFDRCVFESCVISNALEPKLRTTVCNVGLRECELRGCTLDCAVVHDVVVDGLKTHGLFQTWGAVFEHVTLRGKIGRLMISPVVAPGTASIEQQFAFDEANEAFYSAVDWALDISEAEFEECSIRGGIPAKLIRRDRETQVVVTRSNALKGDWRELDLSETYWGVSLELFLREGHQDLVLVAPKRNKKFRQLHRGLQLLREAGVAEPD